jgi:hypothetical protein
MTQMIDVARLPVDPQIGDIKTVALNESYRVWFFAALWKMAKQTVDSDV